MATKKYKPITPSRRFRTGYSFDEITTDKPEKSLLRPIKKTGGRNHSGKITSRRRGGGHKRRYRIIDFKRRDKAGVPAKVATVEYDPNRTANIALLHYVDGEKRYIIAPKGIKVGQTVMAGKDAEVKVGNAKPLGDMLLGTMVHNIETKKNNGAKIARSAGTYAVVEGKEGNYVQIKMPSGDSYLLRKECYATIGQVGNLEHESISIGKAGRNRWKGRRPKVRGTAMNPVDHPMGGGEGKSSGGRHPVSPWGKLSKGKLTRKKRKYSNKFIIKKKKKR